VYWAGGLVGRVEVELGDLHVEGRAGEAIQMVQSCSGPVRLFD